MKIINNTSIYSRKKAQRLNSQKEKIRFTGAVQSYLQSLGKAGQISEDDINAVYGLKNIALELKKQGSPLGQQFLDKINDLENKFKHAVVVSQLKVELSNLEQLCDKNQQTKAYVASLKLLIKLLNEKK